MYVECWNRFFYTVQYFAAKKMRGMIVFKSHKINEKKKKNQIKMIEKQSLRKLFLFVSTAAGEKIKVLRET